MMGNKIILKIDLILIVGSFISLIFLIGYVSPLVIAPLDDYESSEREILFLIEKADKLLIDDNMDFSSPREYDVVDGLKIDLEPGIYYWRAVGIVGSEVRTLTINSEVSLELKASGKGSYEVVNVGNVRLNVDVYNGTELIGRMRLNVDEEAESEGTKFIGEME